MKPKVLLVDGMFPNKYASWRNLFIEAFLREFDTDIAVYKTTHFAGIDYNFDYDYVVKNYNVDFSAYRFIEFDLSKNYLLGSVLGSSQSNEASRLSYVFTRSRDFDIKSYDIVFFIFYSIYLKFNCEFKDISAKKVVYLFPGGGFDFNVSLSLDSQPFYISTHPITSGILKNVGAKFIECLGGPHSRYNDDFELDNRDEIKFSKKFVVNFSSMGFGHEKGDKKFVTIAKIYKFLFFWHKVQFTSVGNCEKSIFVRNYKIMDFASLHKFYKDFVDVQMNLASSQAPNGWPLGVEALRAGCILITTDPNEISKSYPLSDSLIISRNTIKTVFVLRKLYSNPNFNLKQRMIQRQFYLKNFSFKSQQQKIFDWLYTIFTNQ